MVIYTLYFAVCDLQPVHKFYNERLFSRPFCINAAALPLAGWKSPSPSPSLLINWIMSCGTSGREFKPRRQLTNLILKS